MPSPLGLALMMQPSPAQPHPGQVTPTDVLGAFNLSSNMAEQQYQAKLAQQNALWGGLAGLGAAGVIAAPKAFGQGGPLANFIPKSWSGAATDTPVDLGKAMFRNGAQTGIWGVGPTASGVPADIAASGGTGANLAAAPSWFNSAAVSYPWSGAGSTLDAGTTAGSSALGFAPEAVVPSLDAWLAAPAGAEAAGSVAADMAAADSLGAAAPAIADIGSSLAALFPFLFV